MLYPKLGYDYSTHKPGHACILVYADDITFSINNLPAILQKYVLLHHECVMAMCNHVETKLTELS